MSDRKGSFEDILDQYLTRMQGSDADLDSILDEAAKEDIALYQMLVAAARARQNLMPSDPSPDFVRNSEIRMQNRLRALQKTNLETKTKRARPFLRRLRTAPVIISLIVVVAILSSTIGVASAAASSLPGDGLYPLKLEIEKARLALTTDPEADYQLLQEFVDERLNEIESLVEAGRMGDIELAVDAYEASIGQLSRSGQNGPPDGAPPTSDAGMFTHHVEVLMAVQSQVPLQAQAAIQRAIERSLQAGGNDNKQEGQAEQRQNQQEEQQELQAGREEERQEDQAEKEQERDMRRVEQVARQYGVSVDEVLAVYEGICNFEWHCVRSHFRQGGND